MPDFMTATTPALVAVTGASGFIGREVVRRLLEGGWRVRACVHHPAKTHFTTHPNLSIALVELTDIASLVTALRDVDIVVHLAARVGDNKDSEAVNVKGAELLIEACRRQGCQRVINISTQSVKIKRQGIYARTKLAAEELFHSSGLRVTTLRPSIVYGDQTSGIFGAVLRYIQKLPIIPVLGDGKWISAPIHVRDVANAIIACFDNPATIGKRYDLGGPDKISFDALIDLLAAGIGKRARKLHIPFSLALLIARISSVLPKPPLTVSNVLGSNQDTNIDLAPARQDLGLNAMSLNEGLKLIFPETLGEPELAEDFRLIARHLLGITPSESVALRYAAAHRTLLGERSAPEWQFLRRHPLMLPFLDAGAGLLNRGALLRKEILLATAILEASPEHADFFLIEPSSRLGLLNTLIWQGFRAILKITIGIPVYLLIRVK